MSLAWSSPSSFIYSLNKRFHLASLPSVLSAWSWTAQFWHPLQFWVLGTGFGWVLPSSSFHRFFTAAHFSVRAFSVSLSHHGGCFLLFCESFMLCVLGFHSQLSRSGANNWTSPSCTIWLKGWCIQDSQETRMSEQIHRLIKNYIQNNDRYATECHTATPNNTLFLTKNTLFLTNNCHSLELIRQQHSPLTVLSA